MVGPGYPLLPFLAGAPTPPCRASGGRRHRLVTRPLAEGAVWAGSMAASSRLRLGGPRPQVLFSGLPPCFPTSGRRSRGGLRRGHPDPPGGGWERGAGVRPWATRGLSGGRDDIFFPVRATVLISHCSSQIVSDAPEGSARCVPRTCGARY